MVIDYATHSDLDFGTVKMATSILKEVFMIFFALIIFAIIFVPIGLMLTLEDKEEQNSIVPVKKSTEAPMAKTSETTSPTTNTPTTTTAPFGGWLLDGGLPPNLVNLCIPKLSCGINAKLCNPAFIGDGLCDGACNKLNPDNDYATTEDRWDGGDCCIPPIGYYKFCNLDCCECFCYPEGIQYEYDYDYEYYFVDVLPPIIPGPPIAPEPGSCPQSFKGDSYCDAQCNNEENEYDDGDCCLDVISDQYCLNGPPPGCMCHEDGTLHEVLIAR